jgi:excisionase family DNA binding protein
VSPVARAQKRYFGKDAWGRVVNAVAKRISGLPERPDRERSNSPAAPTFAVAAHPTENAEIPHLTVDFAIPGELIEAIAQVVLARIDASAFVSPWLTVDEAADRLRCRPQRIYDLLSSRRLTRYKDGSRTLLSRSELDEYVAGVLPPTR